MRRRAPAVKKSPRKVKGARKASAKRRGSAVSPARLEEMIADATVDAYDEDQAIMGFFSMIEESIAFPFETVVLGVPVTVEGIKETTRGIAAIAARGGTRQAIPIEDLPLPSPPPAGAEWIEAYRMWVRVL